MMVRPNRVLIAACLLLFSGTSWAVAQQADSLPVSEGLLIRLAPSQLSAESQSKVAKLPDLASDTRVLQQSDENRQPMLVRIAGKSVLRFDGVDDTLRLTGTGLSVQDATLFIVAAPHSNPGDFRGFFAANAPEMRDYVSGVNVDLGPGPGRAFDYVNVEGKGFGGANDLADGTVPFGTLHILEVTINSASSRVSLRLDGKDQGARSLKPGAISFDELTLGARFYTNGPGRQEVRGTLHGDIAEVLVYDRVLTADEALKVREYLQVSYEPLAKALPGSLNLNATGGVPLELAKDPPPVQMLVPGFAVRELPLQLTNVNNVRYRHDGVLVTLGYNGDIHLLTDSNGDGVEDTARVFYRNNGALRGPIGMLLTPPDYSRGQGVFVASKGKVSLIVDTNGDDAADDEIIVATGWQEITQNVDATGLAMGPDGSLYFGLGTANYANAYLIDDAGRAGYDLQSVRGTVQRVSADFSKRETVCTGIRFPIAFAFHSDGELFCTEQEGATWMPNGNPLDELLHIRLDGSAPTFNVTGRRHYGFPPRHPVHNPSVIDEPSTFDFGPQHQSTCGMVFNEPVNGGPVFGPASWKSDALVAGESRGKIWRTKLVRTPSGYVASSQLIACLQMLTVDQCVTPDGAIVVACHSGPPDWGTGPAGIGRLFRVEMRVPDAPRPVAAWAQGRNEIRIAFDHPIDPLNISGISESLRIEYGEHVRAGDRFESLVPPYAVVRAQQLKPRFRIPVASAALTPDQRTLILNTAPLPGRTHYAVSLPFRAELTDVAAPPSELPEQHPQLDVDLDACGVDVEWTSTGDAAERWSGWLPHPDLHVAQTLMSGSATHDALWEMMKQPGTLRMSTRLDLKQMLRPAVQPGASIDYQWGPETVAVHCIVPVSATVKAVVKEDSGDALELPMARILNDKATVVRFETGPDQKGLVDLTIDVPTGGPLPVLQYSWSTNEDDLQRPFPLHRFVLPWVSSDAVEAAPVSSGPIAELEGGNWGRGRRVFRSEAAGCFKCHSVNGGGPTIGPDLGNLIHRDYQSVVRDVKNPGFAINPDYTGHILVMNDGRVLTGVLQTKDGQLVLGDAQGRTMVIDRSEIETLKPSPASIMPTGIADKLTPEQFRDLLTYLLTPPPQMPLDSPLSAPPLRTRAEVAAALDGSHLPESLRPLTIVLVDGEKDHGPGEHDYPAWKSAWARLLSGADQVDIRTTREFPDDELLAAADVLIFFQKGSFQPPRPEKLDAFLRRGGGAVYIHWAVNGNDAVSNFAERIGYASWGGKIAFRHGPLTLDIHNTDHPIVRNYDRLELYDESYWKLTGSPDNVTLLATSTEEGSATPQMWVRDHQPGRVFVSIPGHYSWTFDDPLFRILLLRGIAWTAGEPVDRFNDLVEPGARIQK